MQLKRFSDGGFVIHKIAGAKRNQWFSAWFDAQGVILDAERIEAGYSVPRSYSVKRDGPSWNYLAEYGPRYVKSPALDGERFDGLA